MLHLCFRSYFVLPDEMGKLLSKIFGNKEMRILMLGLDAAGKTSILLSKKKEKIHSFHVQ